MRRRRGFTLLEITVVLGVLGILAAAVAADYSQFRRRALAESVIPTMHRIAAALDAYPGGPIACAPTPATVPQRHPVRWPQASDFESLLIRPATHTRFQYEVQLDDEYPGAWVIIARGDLDGDGAQSEYRLDSRESEVRVVDAWE